MKKLIVLVLCLVLLGSLATAAVYNEVPMQKQGVLSKIWSWRNLFKMGGGITAAAVANFEPKQNPPPKYNYPVKPVPQQGKYYNTITGLSVYDRQGSGKYYMTGMDSATWRPASHRCDYFGCK